MTTDRQLPFFVYGTLRPGCGNDRLWRGYETEMRFATLHNCALWFHASGRFPFATFGHGDTAHGDLLTIDPTHYDRVCTDLDYLEGFDRLNPERSFYRRVEVVANLDDGSPVSAWLYLATRRLSDTAHRVPGNDWLAVEGVRS